MDVLEAKNHLESQDINKIREAAEFLKNGGDISCVDPLKKARTTLPVYETALIETIDAAITDITRRVSNEKPQTPFAAEPAEGINLIKETAVPVTTAADTTAGPTESKSEPRETPAEQPKINTASENGNGNANGAPNSEFPQNEYLDKVKDMWEKGKTAAIKNATLLKLKTQLNTIKNDKLLQLKHLGENTYKFFVETPAGVDFIDEQIKNLKTLEEQITNKQNEEKELESHKTEGGIWNVFKGSIAKLAGYTKIKLDISILNSNRESKIAAFGQVIYDKIAECETSLKRSPEIGDILTVIADLERQREEKETEIAELSQQ